MCIRDSYNIDNNFYFVDLPGYGYSKISKEEQVNMGKFIENYLEKSADISLIILLLDIRHNPTNDDVMTVSYTHLDVYKRQDTLSPT